MAGDIHFQQRDFLELSSKRTYGCVITNPPYAERMGSSAEVAGLYRAIPEVLRRLKTWSHFILTAYPDFEALVGQKADRRRKLYNSRIECTYYQFHGPRPPKADSPMPAADAESAKPGEEGDVPTEERAAEEPKRRRPAIQAFGGLTEKAVEQAEIFRSRLLKRARHLRRWPKKGITCYRLYERDVPEVPLVVDRYENCLHIGEFERPDDRTPAEHADWLDLMVRTAAETLEVNPSNVFVKRRRRQRGLLQYERCGDEGRVLVVSEGGLKFEVNLSDYLDTGLFLDHRITRSMVRGEADGKRFLNLFGYTGAFTVYAAAGGARSTLTVDLSNTYLDWAKRNLALNGLAGPAHQFVRGDSVEFLDRLPAKPLFDLAVIDPPTFSNSKMTESFWDVDRDHACLLAAVLQRMSSGGIIYFSTNFRRFKLAEAEIRGATIREISRQTVPSDFRNRRIHRCWRMIKS